MGTTRRAGVFMALLLFSSAALACTPVADGAPGDGSGAVPNGGSSGTTETGGVAGGATGGQSGNAGTIASGGGGTSGSGGATAAGGGAGGDANGGASGAGAGGAPGGTSGATGGDCNAPQPPASCAVCRMASTDTACDGCSKTNCCPALRAFSESMDAAAFNTCAGACSDQTCTEVCVTRFPTAGAAYHAAWDCRFDSCGEECVCVSSTGDSTCTACAKTQCCADYVTYNAASGAAAFSACIAPCTVQSCIDACASSHPEAGAAYRTLSTCLTAGCRTQCGG